MWFVFTVLQSPRVYSSLSSKVERFKDTTVDPVTRSAMQRLQYDVDVGEPPLLMFMFYLIRTCFCAHACMYALKAAWLATCDGEIRTSRQACSGASAGLTPHENMYF